ncbi:rubrerythrin [candidate division LCP-89 bacterium B3_LCP]|uniref:Rubrerythrin n=1 Tax=candidate division LCP-89 bacterium B3_LCP TaxID=2012998 RepID=A0A532V4N7_UNCL8|nr:MAG: rubrerythrin [candidate division LCP-89 bacterium B3_LCP]
MISEKVNEILDFAIKNEEEAYQFYSDLAAKMDKKHMKTIFEDFAKEEHKHKMKLEGIKKGHEFKHTDKQILDLKIGDYMVDVDVEGDLDYQQALTLAMQKEKSAFRLYTDMAEATTDENLKDVFKALAQEEAKHKLRFEIEYDDVFFQEN